MLKAISNIRRSKGKVVNIFKVCEEARLIKLANTMAYSVVNSF